MRVNCSALGGPSSCPFIAEGDSQEEVIQKLTDHVSSTHPDIKAQMDTMSDSEKAQWMDNARSKIEP